LDAITHDFSFTGWVVRVRNIEGTEGGERTDRHGMQVLRSGPWWGISCMREEGDNEGRGKEERALRCVSALDVRGVTLRFNTGEWASDNRRLAEIFEIIFLDKFLNFFILALHRTNPFSRAVNAWKIEKRRSGFDHHPFLFRTHPMTITHRKRQPQPPEEIQSWPLVFSFISATNIPNNNSRN